MRMLAKMRRRTRAAYLGVLRTQRRALYWVLRHRRLREGVTVVTVNFNSVQCLDALYRAMGLFAPGVEFIVVDNHSRDASRTWLDAHPDVRSIRLRGNADHGLGMDLGFLRATTEFVIAIDCDAFPISDQWLDVLLGPLRSGKRVCGVHVHRNYAHPSLLAIRQRDFCEMRLSFEEPMNPSFEVGDTGEAISHRFLSSQVQLLPITSTRGPGLTGSVYADVVYHNFYTARFRRSGSTHLEDGVNLSDAQRAWDDAVAQFLPSDAGQL